MSSVIISGDTSGTVSVTVPAVAGTNTVTLPASTGTVMVSGNMPAFSAYKTAGSPQTISAATFTKVTLGTESFDTASCFDTTNSRFTPTVAGYYQVTGYANFNTARNVVIVSIWKNGLRNYPECSAGTITAGSTLLASGIVYMNGSSDYLEMYAYSDSGTNTIRDEALNTAFSASLVRTA